MMDLYQICFYVPASHLEHVKQAMFRAGAGQYNEYDQCAWQTLGQGQFKPLPGSQPFIGQTNQLTQCPEYKVEMICFEDRIKASIAAFLEAHPYEQPAYSVYKLIDENSFA